MDSRAFKILEKALKGTKLELRSMSLVGANLQPLIDFLLNKNQLRSISLSYNPQLGGSGITELVHHLPSSITEIGLVDCGFGDVGATALLDWI
ncbi:hypothetical protein N9C06_02465 [Salibacteraceae bacterium]|nr:hypothetical protein [Salibacteraceae bacterium]